MQEILQSAENSMHFSAIQKYINVNGILVENYKGFPAKSVSKHKIIERVICLSYCDLNHTLVKIIPKPEYFIDQKTKKKTKAIQDKKLKQLID